MRLMIIVLFLLPSFVSASDTHQQISTAYISPLDIVRNHPVQEVKHRSQSRFISPNYQDMIQKVSDVVEAQIACEDHAIYRRDSVQFNVPDYWQSFKRFWDTRAGDCEDGAFAVAAMLHDDGYPLAFLRIYTRSNQHMVFIYEKNGSYGSAGITVKDLRMAVYPSIKSLAVSLCGNGIIGYRLMWVKPSPANVHRFIVSGGDLRKERIWIIGPYLSIPQPSHLSVHPLFRINAFSRPLSH